MDTAGLYDQSTIAKNKLKENFFKDEFLINRILLIIEKF